MWLYDCRVFLEDKKWRSIRAITMCGKSIFLRRTWEMLLILKNWTKKTFRPNFCIVRLSIRTIFEDFEGPSSNQNLRFANVSAGKLLINGKRIDVILWLDFGPGCRIEFCNYYYFWMYHFYIILLCICYIIIINYYY